MKIKLGVDYKGATKGSIIEIDELTLKEMQDCSIAFAEFTDDVKIQEQETLKKEVIQMTTEVKSEEVVVQKEITTPNINVGAGAPKYANLRDAVKAMKEGKEQVITVKAPSGQNEATANEGGNLVTHELSSEIYGVALTGSVIWDKCRKWVVGPNANGVKLPYKDNSGAISRTATPRAYWLAEGAQKQASKETVGIHDMALGKIVYYIPFTDEILEDVPSFYNYILSDCRSKIAWSLDDAILNLSTATSGMIGLFDAAGANFITTPVAHADPWTPAIVRSVISGVYPSLRSNSEWYFSNNAWANIVGDLGPGVANVLTPIADPKAMTLDGYKVNIIESLAQYQGATPKYGLFGNFGAGYVGIYKGELKIDISNAPRYDYDESVLRMVFRAAGAPVVREATLPDTSVVAAFATVS